MRNARIRLIEMFGRIIGAVWVSIALAALVACGGGGGSSTPTPTGGPTNVTATPNINLPPADAVVIFGSPATTKDAIEQVIAAGGPTSFFTGGESRDDAAFDGLDLSAAFVLGTTLLHPASADFDAAYEAAYGEAPTAGVREAYDAVYVSALAAAAANSSKASDVRKNLHYVANSPGDIASPGSDGFAAARSTLEASGDVNYIGVSGQVDLTANGDISKGQLEVWRLFGGQVLGQEFRDVDLAAEVGADVPAGELTRADGTPQGPLRIGAILPGDESAAIGNAMQMAIDEINASGGVLGFDAELLVDTPEPEDAVATAESMANSVSVIIGLPDEEAAQAVADDYANPTSVPVLTLSAAEGLPIDANEGFWRVAPSGLLETPVLANLAVEADLGSACVLYEGNANDEALAKAFKAAFEYKEGGVRALVEVKDETDLQACLGT